MTDSLAERALCEVARRLKSIRTDDGYSTDAGLNVFRARRAVSVEELPCVIVWDGGEQVQGAEGAGGGVMTMALTVNIEVLARSNQASTGYTLEHLKADVKRALTGAYRNGSVDLQDGNNFGALQYAGAVPFSREDGGQSESLTLNYQVSYAERYGDPTTKDR